MSTKYTAGQRVIYTDAVDWEHRAIVKEHVEGKWVELDFLDHSNGCVDEDEIYPATDEDWLRVRIDTNLRCMEKLTELAVLIPEDVATHVAVCEFSSEDETPTLHIEFEDGKCEGDLPDELNPLVMVRETSNSISYQVCEID